MKKLLKEIKSLKKVDRDFLIFQLLLDEDITYHDITLLYIEYLKEKNKEQNLLISGLVMPLSYYVGKYKGKREQDKFMKCKGIFNILKSRLFHTAQIEKEYIAYLKKHSYSEDEEGYRIK